MFFFSSSTHLFSFSSFFLIFFRISLLLSLYFSSPHPTLPSPSFLFIFILPSSSSSFSPSALLLLFYFVIKAPSSWPTNVLKANNSRILSFILFHFFSSSFQLRDTYVDAKTASHHSNLGWTNNIEPLPGKATILLVQLLWGRRHMFTFAFVL